MSSLGNVAARVMLTVSLALVTAGCADPEADYFPQDSQFADAACRAIANDRANDAETLVDTKDEQRQVFKLTYASCMDWRRTALAPNHPQQAPWAKQKDNNEAVRQ